MPVSRAWRIGHVIGQLTRGGAERQLAMLVRELDRARFVPIVYCLSAATEPFGPQITATGATLKILDGSPAQRVRRLRRELAADAVDLVHAWLYVGNAYAACAHAFTPSRPLVTSARNCKVQGRWANAFAFRSSRAIVANSGEVAAYIARQYWAPAGRIRVIHNAIDTRRFRPAELGASGTQGPIVTVGRLVEQKNHALFLDAAAQLLRELPQAQFVITGDGPLRSALEQQARTLGIADRVSFTGERDDIEVLLQSASLFWLTSRWEGMPNVVLEAMASGVPVITTDVSGVRELLRPGVDGFVVTKSDAAEFAAASTRLLRDPGAWRNVSAAARTRAEEFSVAAMVDAWARLYDELLEQGR